MSLQIPDTGQKRIIIVGCGFAGLALATRLNTSDYQVVLIDRNNYHQFQPLFYQVATAGLEPSAISFPLRKIFQRSSNCLIRIAEVLKVDPEKQILTTNLGSLWYDYLVLATGTTTNFFNLEQVGRYAIPMKSVSEALALRNLILQNFEDAVTCSDPVKRDELMTIVVVGGGPTGVEVSGTLAEMKKFILPKDFPELNFSRMHIYLLEAGNKLLNGMSAKSSRKAEEYLLKMGVKVRLNSIVQDFDGQVVNIQDGSRIHTRTLVWAAGVTGKKMEGLPESVYTSGNRIRVDRYNRVEGAQTLFALGDIAYMTEPEYPAGHPQVAQPAIQQAHLLAANLLRLLRNQPMKEFHYRNKGNMATVGRNRALVDLPFISFRGFFAWLTWMFVHLMAIVGVKNRLLIFINWFWNYITYDQSLRLIIRPYNKSLMP
jgi:NADH dehydrogenase